MGSYMAITLRRVLAKDMEAGPKGAFWSAEDLDSTRFEGRRTANEGLASMEEASIPV